MTPDLIVMLTHHDYTVENAEEIFALCRHTDARYWGMKELPLPIERMKALFADMKRCGKKTVLEVVGYSEQEGLRGAQTAVECGCDILMGTFFQPSIATLCRKNNIQYLPFVGSIECRPSVLTGDIEGIVAQAQDVVSAGADGIDLLGYRYAGDAPALNKALCRALPGKVCLAGSIDSPERIEEVKEAGARFFTIGSAFFDGRFGNNFAESIDAVLKLL